MNPALLPIDLVVSDVDGTLVRPDKSLGDATLAAVRRLREAGALFTVISSRPPHGLRYPIEALEIDRPVAAYNGGTIVDPDGRIVSSKPLAADIATEALDLLARYGLQVWAFADDRWLALDPEGVHVPLERRTVRSDPVIVESFEPWIDRIDKLVGVSDDHARLALIETEIAAALHGRAHAVRSQAYYLDINALDADKGHGVAALAQRIGVPLERVAVIGDGFNDLPMFERAGLSIAMGQADERVQAKATFVTTSHAEDGVAAAIERYLLPRVGQR